MKFSFCNVLPLASLEALLSRLCLLSVVAMLCIACCGSRSKERNWRRSRSPDHIRDREAERERERDREKNKDWASNDREKDRYRDMNVNKM